MSFDQRIRKAREFEHTVLDACAFVAGQQSCSAKDSYPKVFGRSCGR